jgi:pimeloyl-ACP methyl ester carboxylesterase
MPRPSRSLAVELLRGRRVELQAIAAELGLGRSRI